MHTVQLKSRLGAALPPLPPPLPQLPPPLPPLPPISLVARAMSPLWFCPPVFRLLPCECKLDRPANACGKARGTRQSSNQVFAPNNKAAGWQAL